MRGGREKVQALEIRMHGKMKEMETSQERSKELEGGCIIMIKLGKEEGNG